MSIRARPPHERAMDKIAKPHGQDGCWVWTGSRDGDGYGRISVAVSPGRSVPTSVHRLMYETYVGPIPAGLELDHAVCQDRSCVNPGHLEPVSHAENMRRARRATCRAGHPRSARDPRGCVPCRQARERRRVRRPAPQLEGTSR